ncbi:MAG: DUF1214 domain-containing protein [Pseudomonadota bacterium]
MRQFFVLFFVVLIGLAGGGALSWVSIQNNHGFGALTVGRWTAWPLAGSRDADPYTRAKVAADGEVPLGAAEGLAFHALTDEAGRALRRQCQYRLSGQTPPARYWTLAAHGLTGAVLGDGPVDASRLISHKMLRSSDGRFSLEVGPRLAGGNWLAVRGQGEYQLILRLYDSPITSTRGIVDPEMPRIELLGCAA